MSTWLDTLPWWGRLIGMCAVIIVIAYLADRTGRRPR